MATIVTLRQAQEGLAELLERVAAGEEILIAEGGRVVAKLVLPAENASPADEVAATPRFESIQGG